MADLKFPTRYSKGVVEILHRGKVITTNVGSPTYDKFLENLENTVQVRSGFIPAGFEHRPDNISDVFYDTPAHWWLLMLVNTVFDPFEGFDVGDRILIPNL